MLSVKRVLKLLKKDTLQVFVIFSFGLYLSGCATYQTKISGGYNELIQGNPGRAAEIFKPLAEEEGKDQLVYLFEYGTALQLAQRYDESNKVFLLADKMSEIKDYHSISKITTSLLLNEGQMQYKGDDFEKVIINAFLAINFLMKGELDSALVETRRLNEKLTKYRVEAKRDYEQNPFARYLGALIWESDGRWDDAYIDYAEVMRLNPSIESLKKDLLFAAKKSGRGEEVEKLKKQFPGVSLDPSWNDPKVGEIVLIYQQGQGPIKQPNPDFVRVPKLYPRYSFGQRARMLIEGVGEIESEVISSVQDVAIKTLDDAYAGIVAKRMAGIATKAVVADQIRQKDKLLGDLAWIASNLADQADLRQWASLPQTFQVARKRVPAGKYKVKVLALSAANQPTGEILDEQEIEVKPRKKTFLNWRSFR